VASDSRLAVAPGSPCRFCGWDMRVVTRSAADVGQWHRDDQVLVCDQCGWHMAWRSEFGTFGPKRIENSRIWAAAASLRNLDVTDVATPMEDVCAFLIAKSSARFDVHPRLMEQVVTDVFRDHGWTATLTAYSNDGGIDVILDGDGKRIGVQVKRYKDSIQVEQIRALVGALVAADLTRGVFVTTSRFSKGAKNLGKALESERKPYRVELIDGEGFLRELQIVQRAAYRDLDDVPGALAARLKIIDEFVDTNSGVWARGSGLEF
jgi:restriction system protein